MEMLYGFLIALLFSFVVVMMVSTLILWMSTSPSDCKKVYNELPSKTFYRNGDCVYDTNLNSYLTNPSEYFIWFTDDNSFKICKGKYLHNFLPTYFSPIHLYWLIKYRKWFKENVDINKLEKF